MKLQHRLLIAPLLLMLALLTTPLAALADGGGDRNGREAEENSQAMATITPKAPTFDSANGWLVIPDVEGVRYFVNGVEYEPDTYEGVGIITVTVKAGPGYTLGSSPTWRHDFGSVGRPFVDVPVGSQHSESIEWLFDVGITTGWQTANGREYRPLEPVARDAMVVFMYRLAGEPYVELPKSSPFIDVATSNMYYKEIIWAYNTGITTGWAAPQGKREFRPTEPVNRDAMAAFLYRLAGSPAYTAPSTKCFADVPKGMQFEKEMCWMKARNISTGWGDGTYRPLEPVKRDAMAAFLERTYFMLAESGSL